MPRTLVHKLMLMGGVLLLVVAVSAVITIRTINHRIAAATHVAKHTLPFVERRGYFNSHMAYAIAETLEYSSTGDASDRAQARTQLEKAEINLHLLVLSAEAKQLLSQDHVQTHEQQERRREEFFLGTRNAIRATIAARDRNDAAAMAESLEALERFSDKLQQLQIDVSADSRQEMAEVTVQQQALARDALLTRSTSIGIFVLTVLGLSAALHRYIVQPIKQLSVAAQTVTNGDLDVRVPHTSNDEIGELQHAFNQMVENLQTQHSIRAVYEHELTKLAFHDPLSNLPNRALFLDRLKNALGSARRQNTHLAVMFLDLDGFKSINDTLGHHAGDQLLITVSERICSQVRANDTVARLGGDEFTALLEDVTIETAVRIVERIQAQLQQPVVLDGQVVTTAASIGIALSCADDSLDDVLRNADTAMYHAKSVGKGRYAVFNASMAAHLNHHQRWRTPVSPSSHPPSSHLNTLPVGETAF